MLGKDVHKQPHEETLLIRIYKVVVVVKIKYQSGEVLQIELVSLTAKELRTLRKCLEADELNEIREKEEKNKEEREKRIKKQIKKEAYYLRRAVLDGQKYLEESDRRT